MTTQQGYKDDSKAYALQLEINRLRLVIQELQDRIKTLERRVNAYHP